MRYYWGIVLISLGIVVMVLDPFDKLDAYLRGTANTVLTATLLGLAALTTVVALWGAAKPKDAADLVDPRALTQVTTLGFGSAQTAR